jgi:DNA-binding transcriptional LysR family regulator
MALKVAGIQMKHPRVVVELDSTEAMKSAVEAGLGIGFVPVGLFRKKSNSTRYTLCEVHIKKLDIQRMFAIIYPRGPEPRGAGGISPFSPRKARP